MKAPSSGVILGHLGANRSLTNRAEILATRFGEGARELVQELTRDTESAVLKEWLRQAIAINSLEEFEQILKGVQSPTSEVDRE